MTRRAGLSMKLPGLAAPAGLALALLLAAAPAQAQKVPGQPDAATGAALAGRLCSNCHLTGTDTAQHKTMPADVPSFKEIANIPGQTRAAIVTAITLPKHPMPTIQLTRDELGDLAEYIISLRQTN